MTRHSHLALTRSGRGPTDVPDFKPHGDLPALRITYYAPKPPWMTHIPGPRLRFANRHALDAHLRRTA